MVEEVARKDCSVDRDWDSRCNLSSLDCSMSRVRSKEANYLIEADKDSVEHMDFHSHPQLETANSF